LVHRNAIVKAIVSGGEVGGNVKVIRQQTDELKDKLNTAATEVDQIAANTHSFNGVTDKQNEVLYLTNLAIEQMSSSVNKTKNRRCLKIKGNYQCENANLSLSYQRQI
jgi:methyl-accepting chemotaxis protein